MFIKFSDLVTLQKTTQTKFPKSINNASLSVPPKSVTGTKSGTALVLNYIELLKFWLPKGNALRASQSLIDSIYDKAVTIDQENGQDTEIPSLYGIMNACKSINNAYEPIFLSPEKNTIMSYIHRFGAIIIEVGISKSLQSPGFSITSIEDPENEDFSKGLIAYGYDDKRILVMNSLSEKWGSLGFSTITWDCLLKQSGLQDNSKFLIKCAVFKNGFN